MPRAKSDKDGQVTIVLPRPWLEEARGLAREWESRSEFDVTVRRADVLRTALRRGLDSLLAESSKTVTKKGAAR